MCIKTYAEFIVIVAAMGAENIFFLPFHPITVRAQPPPILAVLDDVTVRLVLALFSGFPTKANSPGSISSWFYQLSKDHLQHFTLFKEKDGQSMAACFPH